MSAASVDTIVRGGQVVTASDVFEAAVAIKGDKIVALGPEALLPPADRVIDASGKYVLPGLIDCHLHIGAEYDDWKTAPLAAARTGLTTLLPFVVYDDGETLAEGRRAAPRGGERAVRPRLRLSLHPEPRAVHPRRHPRGGPDGRHVVQALHDLQEAGEAHGLRRVHRPDHGAPGPARRPLPAPLRERRHPLLPRGQGDRRGPHGADGLPADLPGLDRGRGHQPRHPHRPADRLPRVRRAPLHPARPGAHQARAGRRAARVDGDVSAVPAPDRQGDGAPRALRQDRPAAQAGRRARPRRAVGRARSRATSRRWRAITRRACPRPRSRADEHLRRHARASPFRSARRRSKRSCRSCTAKAS